MKRLDLTINGKLNTKHAKIFEDICSKNISSFTTLIGKISLNYKNNLDWHLSLPASRNTLISDLFSILFLPSNFTKFNFPGIIL